MRVANLNGRAVIIAAAGLAVDIHQSSGGSIGPDMRSVFDRWDDVRSLAASIPAGTGEPFRQDQLGCVVPEPRQVFAIGLNYRSHAAESGRDVPTVPATFTKFPAALSGPFDDIEIVGDTIDWEVELVVVLGRRADRVAESDGWAHVAGLTVGQDISDRTLQLAAGGQFSLGKSRRGFGPLGPMVVTPDEFDDSDDLALGCSVNGETVQDARTSDLVFNVPRLIAELSSVLPLLAGDVIFTGTPAGVGVSRMPPRALRAGDVLETWIEGIGTMRNRCV
jgi:2-keto-4-pentenoate hydratase/2-oxohepta-3-ene-1,7-dioic acid hydratase in catechol pathway